jgi:hypothetical protein
MAAVSPLVRAKSTDVVTPPRMLLKWRATPPASVPSEVSFSAVASRSFRRF